MRVNFFFFNDTATTEIYTLSLHDALPIFSLAENSSRSQCTPAGSRRSAATSRGRVTRSRMPSGRARCGSASMPTRSEEHTSELQSRQYLVCRLLLEKKKHAK